MYSRGATTVFPAISIGTGCVNGTICDFPEKPTVLMDVLERGSPEPVLPIHEYVAPVSTIKGYSRSCIITGMVGSSCGCVERIGAITSPLGSSGPPYRHSAAGPVHGFVGQSLRR